VEVEGVREVVKRRRIWFREVLRDCRVVQRRDLRVGVV
jgi:hypothetical protein